jgi:hypothetical protein
MNPHYKIRAEDLPWRQCLHLEELLNDETGEGFFPPKFPPCLNPLSTGPHGWTCADHDPVEAPRHPRYNPDQELIEYILETERLAIAKLRGEP